MLISLQLLKTVLFKLIENSAQNVKKSSPKPNITQHIKSPPMQFKQRQADFSKSAGQERASRPLMSEFLPKKSTFDDNDIPRHKLTRNNTTEQSNPFVTAGEILQVH